MNGEKSEPSDSRLFNFEGTNPPVELTISIVPNVHVTYFVLPKWVASEGKN
jgi:hypothetical protein